MSSLFSSHHVVVNSNCKTIMVQLWPPSCLSYRVKHNHMEVINQSNLLFTILKSSRGLVCSRWECHFIGCWVFILYFLYWFDWLFCFNNNFDSTIKYSCSVWTWHSNLTRTEGNMRKFCESVTYQFSKWFDLIWLAV